MLSRCSTTELYTQAPVEFLSYARLSLSYLTEGKVEGMQLLEKSRAEGVEVHAIAFFSTEKYPAD